MLLVFQLLNLLHFLNIHGIEHVTSQPYSPSLNSQAERGMRVIKGLLKKQQKTDSFRNKLTKALFHYRCTPHNVTHIAPSIALNGRKLVTVQDKINPLFCYSKSIHDGRQCRQYEIGDDVLALNVRNGPN